MPETMLTVLEAAKRLGIDRRTVNVWIRKGQLPGAYQLDPSNPRSRYRIPESDIERIESMRREQAEN